MSPLRTINLRNDLMAFDAILDLRYVFLTIVSVNISISWDNRPCSLVDRYQLIEESFCLHRQDRRNLLLADCTEHCWVSLELVILAIYNCNFKRDYLRTYSFTKKTFRNCKHNYLMHPKEIYATIQLNLQ